VTEPDPFLQRAASFLRSVPEPGWDAISARVLAAVHAAPRIGWPLRVDTISTAIDQGTIYLSDHALRAILARELRRTYVCQLTNIAFILEGTALRAIDITITGSYGTQLRELGDAIRQTVLTLVGDLLDNPNHPNTRPIDVTVTDIVTGDPLLP
jgi:hypothetical protein